MEIDNKVAKRQVFLTFALSIMTLSIPGLYLVGFFYDLGYMEVFNVSNDLFKKSVHGYLVNAFYVFMILTNQILDFANNSFFKVWVVLLGLLFAVLGFLDVFIKRHQKNLEQKIYKISQYKYYEYFAVSGYFGFLGIIILYLVIITLCVLAIIPIGAYYAGENEARKAIKSYGECNINKLKPDEKCTFVYKNEKLQVKGLRIASSETHLAIFDGNKSIVYPIGNSIIHAYNGK